MKNFFSDLTGYLGALLVIALPSLNHIEQGLRILGAIGGLVLVFYSARYQRMKIKKFIADRERENNFKKP